LVVANSVHTLTKITRLPFETQEISETISHLPAEAAPGNLANPGATGEGFMKPSTTWRKELLEVYIRIAPPFENVLSVDIESVRDEHVLVRLAITSAEGKGETGNDGKIIPKSFNWVDRIMAGMPRFRFAVFPLRTSSRPAE